MKTLILFILFPIFLNASDTISNILFDDTSVRLEAAIFEMNKRQNAAAYNIANASTPGFKPIRFQDEVDEAIRLYGDASMLMM